ncbi:peptidase [Amylibacter kogurei]|uniref:Peptidase n=1 Tax=Paramylibacter kogurei TaxID=1889778 RepID=A0A2G5KB50_9RHOB|nr:L,D-transpeptidase [Amylibacter kogurei]PIB26748.1 peptidase [Amylibacter kogurei]
MSKNTFTRRAALIAGAGVVASLATPHIAVAATGGEPVRRNLSGWRKQDWRDHFDTLGVGAIIADTASRALHYWNSDASDYRVYPTSVPMSEELTKRGYTEVVRKRVGPDWTPTQDMLKRNPELKYMPPGPGNPLGTHAMYLSWPAYLIHGTHDTRKIGRPSSSGCIGLYNEKIEELFAITPVGTQVLIL